MRSIKWTCPPYSSLILSDPLCRHCPNGKTFTHHPCVNYRWINVLFSWLLLSAVGITNWTNDIFRSVSHEVDFRKTCCQFQFTIVSNQQRVGDLFARSGVYQKFFLLLNVQKKKLDIPEISQPGYVSWIPAGQRLETSRYSRSDTRNGYSLQATFILIIYFNLYTMFPYKTFWQETANRKSAQYSLQTRCFKNL